MYLIICVNEWNVNPIDVSLSKAVIHFTFTT